MIYLVTFALILAYCVTNFFKYYNEVHSGAKGYYARVEKDGGSVFFSKLFMNYGVWALTPLIEVLKKYKVTPNHITFASLGFAFISGLLVSFGFFFPAGILCAISAIFDALDGMLARDLKISSLSGSILDSTIDRISEFFIGFGLIVFYRGSLFGMIACFTLLLGSMLVSYASAKAEILNLNPPRGVMRRGERALYLTLAFLLAPVLSFISSTHEGNFVILALLFIGPISIFSALQRNYWMYQKLDSQDQSE